MDIKNYTPHTINILDGDNNTIMELPSEGIARAAVFRNYIGMIDNIPINSTKFGDLTGLPEPEDGVMYLLSAVAANAAKAAGRMDILITDDAVRDDQGRIIGCRSLAIP